MRRYGLTVPFAGGGLGELRPVVEEAVSLGYTDLWSAEADGQDGFTPLALASVWAPSARLGGAIFPAYTRGPALLAMSAASLEQAAPGRFVMGLGASSPAIVERWNGIPFEEPYKRTRDVLRFLNKALTGEKINEKFESFEIQGFRLGVKLDSPPKIMLAALREGMLRLAARESDGAILNWLSTEDAKRVTKIVKDIGPGKETVARLFVAPNADAEQVRAMARFAVNAYVNVPVYKAFHQWLGRDALGETWEKWEAGDRKGAAAAIPDHVVDELVIHGPPEKCREHIAEYVANGIDTPVLAIMPFGIDPLKAMRDLAPGAL